VDPKSKLNPVGRANGALDRDTARRELFAYIEGYYNRARIHSAIGYITPQQAEASAA
jgi:transposase InsO family protein